MSVLIVLAQVAAVWLVTDFLSGVFHWMEDAYGHPSWPILGRHVTKPNILHHYAPRAFIANSWWRSSRLLLAICLLLTAATLVMGVFNWMVALSMFLGLNANQVHKWSHRSRRENNALVRWLQRWRLIQSPSHHHRHHVHCKDSHYCVLTDFLNPALDRMHFWRGAERFVERVFGVRRRDDATMAREVLATDPAVFGAHLETVRQQIARLDRADPKRKTRTQYPELISSGS